MLSIRSKAGVDESVNTMRVAAILTERSKYPDRISREEFHKQQELEAESVSLVKLPRNRAYWTSRYNLHI